MLSRYYEAWLESTTQGLFRWLDYSDFNCLYSCAYCFTDTFRCSTPLKPSIARDSHMAHSSLCGVLRGIHLH